MAGAVVTSAFAVLWFLLKAAFDVVLFKDRQGAKRSLFLSLVFLCSLGAAVGFALLSDSLG